VKETIKEASQMADEFRDIHGYWIEHGGWIYANLRTGGVATYIKPPATSPTFKRIILTLTVLWRFISMILQQLQRVGK
jgi:hypothetical protein